MRLIARLAARSARTVFSDLRLTVLWTGFFGFLLTDFFGFVEFVFWIDAARAGELAGAGVSLAADAVGVLSD
jgi:hypothetical protein